MNSTNFLRRALLADAVISGASALLLLFGSAPLSRLLSVPPDLLRYAGVSLIPFTAFVAFLCTRASVSRGPVWTVIALNLAWVVASVLVLMTDTIDPNRIGIAFILVQAAAVLVFAEVQYVGLRRVVRSTTYTESPRARGLYPARHEAER